jgi:hypothetical protein
MASQQHGQDDFIANLLDALKGINSLVAEPILASLGERGQPLNDQRRKLPMRVCSAEGRWVHPLG